MVSDPGDYIGGGQTYYFTPADGSFFATGFLGGVTIRFNTPSYSEWWYLDFAARDGEPLVVGSYPDAERYPFQGPGHPGLSIVGDGRGCNTLTGSFEVTEIEYGQDFEVLAFRATFEQHCEGAEPALRGEVMFNADTPTAAAPRSWGSIKAAFR
jgi:hypothetical protein